MPEYRENTQLVLEAGTHRWQLVYIVVAARSDEGSRAAQRASFNSGWALMSRVALYGVMCLDQDSTLGIDQQ